jgi:hypothetical protein
MFKIAALVWIMLSVTLAGTALLIIVTIPPLAEQAAFLIPVVCSGAIVAAMPFSYLIARRIAGARAA